MLNEEKTEIRELAVCLGIADAASGNGIYDLGDIEPEYDAEYGFDVPYVEQEYPGSDGNSYTMKTIDYETNVGWADNGLNDSNPYDGSFLEDGAAFCNRLRSYGIDIDRKGHLFCDHAWSRGLPAIAKRNYALGLMIAEAFGLGPGSVERIHWYGPDNVSREERKQVPPADIGIKLVGTPQRSFYAVNNMILGADPELYPKEGPEALSTLIEQEFYDGDSDIMISLKDGSSILGNLGFAEFANMMLALEQTVGSIDCFEYYAKDEYDYWFDVAWNILLQYIASNGSFSHQGSVHNYYIYEDEEGLVFESEGRDGKVTTFRKGYEMTRDEWMAKRQTGAAAKKAFSYFCTSIANKEADYIRAQMMCSHAVSMNVSACLANGATTESFYNLIGWRLPEYYYAKTDKSSPDLKLYLVPTAFGMGLDYPIKAIPQGTPIVSDEADYTGNTDLTTQAISVVTLMNEDLGMHAEIEIVMRFKDGMFNKIPAVTVSTRQDANQVYQEVYHKNIADYGLK